MSTIVAFFLMITALASTALIVWSPFERLTKKMEGKKTSDFEKQFDSMDSTSKVTAFLKYGCGYGCLCTLAVLLGWVFEPLFVVGGLVTHLGNPLFGYIAMMIILIIWLRFILVITFRKPKSEAQIVWEATEAALERTQQGYKAKPFVSDEPIKVNWFEHYFWKVLGAIPTAYLWYLLAVMIGLVSNG